MSRWVEAFKKAKAVEQEGEDSAEAVIVPDALERVSVVPVGTDDRVKLFSKRKLEQFTGIDDANLKEEEESEDIGAFCQPKKLARFIQEVSLPSSSSHRSMNTSTREESVDRSNTQRGSSDKKKLSSRRESDDTTCNSNEEDKSGGGSAAPDEESHKKPKRTFEESCARQICRSWLKHSYLEIGAPCQLDPCPRMHNISCRAESLYSDYSFKGLPAKQRKRILEKVKLEQSEKEM